MPRPIRLSEGISGRSSIEAVTSPQKSSRRLLRPPRTKPMGIIWNMFGTSGRVQVGSLG